MRRYKVFIVASLLALVVCLGGCAGQSLHNPTTVENAGTTALVAYGVSGIAASNYYALPLCAIPAVYPCKTKAANDALFKADTAAHTAALAADAAANDPTKQQKATDTKDDLQKALNDPAVKSQLDLVNAKKAGGAP